MTSVFFCIYEVAYVVYTWKRGELVVKRVSKKLHKAMKLQMRFFPTIVALQLIPTLALCFAVDTKAREILTKARFISGGFGGFIGLVIDAQSAICFIAFLNKVYDGEEAVNYSYATISKFGTLSCCLAIAGLFVFIPKAMGGQEGEYANFLASVMYFLLSMSYLAMFVMKLRLFRQGALDRESSMKACTKECSYDSREKSRSIAV
ncbi:hypothetical protein BDR26DRAFT_857618 [Obelidium mucronatum]|nr:hypothetical protein BDR26DRAFT_857618 [Obelidium mucronatum]